MNIMTPTFKNETIKAKVAKFNRKAKKLNCEQVGVTFSAPFIKLVTPTVTDGYDIRELTSVPVEYNEVTFTVPTIRLGGWNLMALVEATPEGNIITPLATGDIPAEFRTSDPSRCDHCNTARRRNRAFIVTDGTEWKQVGSTCVQDFTGHNVAGALATTAFVSWITDLREVDEYEECSHAPRLFKVKEALALAMDAIRRFGFKRSDSEDGSTKELVAVHLDPPPRFEKVLTPADIEECFEWVLAQDASGDYMHSLQVALRNEYLPFRFLGLVVSAPQAFLRTQASPKQESEFVGVVKKRDTFTVKVTKIHTFDSQFGRMAIILMEDSQGNVLVWKTGSGWWMEVGNVFDIKATVKEHALYGNLKQTVITRVVQDD